MRNPITFLLVSFLTLGISMCGRFADAQTVTATVTPLHSVEIKTVTPVSVAVVNDSTPKARDYVILVPAGTPVALVLGDFNNNPWKYLNDQTGGAGARPPAGLTKATVNFQVIEIGEYEARLYRRPDAEFAPHVFLNSSPVSVKLTPIEVSGVKCTVTRKPDTPTDELSLTIQGSKCTIVASKGTPVKNDNIGATP